MQHKQLYIGVLISLFFLVLFSLGGAVWGADNTLNHWTGKLFYGVCHQIPDRSFHLNGVAMAVNTRCFGVFAGLFASWFFIPLLKKVTVKKAWPLWLLFVAVMLQIIDYSGNQFQIWENTNLSRAILGFMLGAAVPLAVSDMFQPKNKITE